MSATPDAVRGWVDKLPPRAAAFARLGRFDRPSGAWLLFWPCLMGAFLAPPEGWWPYWPAFFVGAIAMRAAGCVYNDIVDRDLDRQVTRTALRPLASGTLSLKQAWTFLTALASIGLAVLLLLPFQAQLVALFSLVLVAGYPFMKRITWWPQAWLGLTFNWGLPVGWAAAAADMRADISVMLLVYLGTVFWTLGYDSIYAAQDMEDDALAGIKSSARRMGSNLKLGVGIFYALFVASFAAALWIWTADWLVMAGLLPAAAHLLWQATTFDPASTPNSLTRFRSNQWGGALLVLPMLLAGFIAHP